MRQPLASAGLLPVGAGSVNSETRQWPSVLLTGPGKDFEHIARAKVTTRWCVSKAAIGVGLAFPRKGLPKIANDIKTGTQINAGAIGTKMLIMQNYVHGAAYQPYVEAARNSSRWVGRTLKGPSCVASYGLCPAPVGWQDRGTGHMSLWLPVSPRDVTTDVTTGSSLSGIHHDLTRGGSHRSAPARRSRTPPTAQATASRTSG